MLTATGGLPELVDEGAAGYPAGPSDPESPAQSIIKGLVLASDQSLPAHIARKSESFSWSSYSRSLMESLQ